MSYWPDKDTCSEIDNVYHVIFVKKKKKKKKKKKSIEANSVDPEQTAPIGAVWSGSKLFAIEAS